MNIATSVLLCPRNDEESLMILKLAQAISLPTVISRQPHGARLRKEPKLLARILEANPQVKCVIIVEIPGEAEERMLREEGLEVILIDHHRYDESDRRNAKSSLEQFRDFVGIDDAKAQELGFDPHALFSVAAMDRGFVWELRAQGYTHEMIREALAFYRSLTLELGEARRLREETAAQEAWNAREEREGIFIVRSPQSDISVRDALSFIVANTYEEPHEVFLIQGHRRMYVQDTRHAPELFEAFGGFLFGGDRCWGILKDDENLPPEEEVLKILLRKKAQ